MLLTPRDYQDFGARSVFEYWGRKPGNPLLAYPTGTGKSIIVAQICLMAMQMHAGTTILMLTKTKELVAQNYEKLKLCWPESPVGIYSDGLNRKEHHFPITFGTIGSMYKVAHLFGFIHFVVVDEAHEISPDENTMYQKLFADLRVLNPDLKVIGLTATPYRMKQGKLTEGENALFTDIVVDATGLEAFNWFFHEGYLVPPVPRPTTTKIDISKVKISQGEYSTASMTEAFAPKDEQMVIEMLELSKNRFSKLVFASGVDHCKRLVDILRHYGASATWVASNGMTSKERDRNILAYKNNEFEWMVNNGILTTGFDKTDLDFIGMCRLTLSPGLWVQMLGRGTRPHYAPGFDLSTRDGRIGAIGASHKWNCLVADFAKNVTRLGPINDPRVPNRKEQKSEGTAPVRICDQCGCYCHASARQCWNCGHEFPRANKLEETSSTQALVRSGPVFEFPKVEPFNVDRVEYQIWKKPGKPDSIRVTYHCGQRIINEWVCFEHGDKARGIAKRWWRARTNLAAPSTTEEAYELIGGLKQPRTINAITNKPNLEIHSHEF